MGHGEGREAATGHGGSELRLARDTRHELRAATGRGGGGGAKGGNATRGGGEKLRVARDILGGEEPRVATRHPWGGGAKGGNTTSRVGIHDC